MGIDALEEALSRLDVQAPRARSRADAGDPQPLAELIDHALAGERRLTDEGHLRELAAQAPAAGERFASYLAFPFGREARARARIASTELEGGKVRFKSAEAMARLRRGDTAERQIALAALGDLDEALDTLASIAPDPVPRVRPAAVEPARHGSILLPTAELMAELGLVTAGPPAPGATGPDQASALGELSLALAEATGGRRPLEYGALRVAVAGREVADFRVRHPLVGPGTLPFDQPLVPWGRGTAHVIADGDSWSAVAALLGGAAGAIGAALAFAATTLPFQPCFADGGANRRRTARAVAAALAWTAFECQLVAHACSLEDLSNRESGTVGFARPLRLARLLWTGARFESAPGEASARYAGGGRTESMLCRGAGLARSLRERFDEDWFRNPRATREILDDSARAEAGGIDQVIDWLKESLEL